MPESQRGLALLPVRIFVGWVFLRASLVKLTGGWLAGHKLGPIIEGWLADGRPYGFYAPFLRNVVLPSEHTFGALVTCGELVVGATLLAGLFTRVGALVGVALATSFLLGRGDGAEANATAPFIAMTLTLLMGHSGRALGLDAALADRVPPWLT